MGRHHIEIEGVAFDWDTEESRLEFAGQDATLLWTGSTLCALFEAIREQATDAYPSIVSAWGRRTGLAVGPRLQALGALARGAEGAARLLAICRTAGWGVTTILSADEGTHEVRMRVRSSWEWRLKEAMRDGGCCHFLPQHWAGIWTAYFGEDMVAEELRCQTTGADACEYRVVRRPPAFDEEVGAFFPSEARRQLVLARETAADQAELAEAAAELVGTLDLDEQLARIVRRARFLSGADYAAVATMDDTGATVWRAVDGARSRGWRDVVFPARSGTAGRVIARDEPVVVTGFPNNPDFPPAEFPTHLAEGMVTSFGVPIRSGGRPFGAIIVGWRRDVPVTPANVQRVQTLADLAGAALTEARLLRATEERNRELDARVAELDAVLDQMADGVVIADTTGTIVRANPAAERMHGARLAGHHPAQAEAPFELLRVDGSPYPPAELPLQRAATAGVVVEGTDWLVRQRNGAVVHLLGSASPLRDRSGAVIGGVLVMRDVTERERLVDELRRATSIKERFFAQMSHELRTPVNAVLGYAGLMREGLAGELTPRAQEMLDRIRKAGQHLLELVNDTLDMSRLEAGKVHLAPRLVELAGLARDTLLTVEPAAMAKGLALRMDAPSSCHVVADPQRVRQVLINLLGNAVKFTEHGSITVDLTSPEPSVVHLSVADTGPGIAAEDRERIFQEFVQVGNRADGTGLGLAISRRLAALMGGTLTVESEPGRGSRFTLALPAEQR